MDPLILNSPMNAEKGMKTSLKWEASQKMDCVFLAV